MSLHEKHHRSSAAATANAVGGKTARACDSCLRRRARWYCAADDAFLCQSCDSSVHSANPLARRHDRVRLKTASAAASPKADPFELHGGPAWHQGFKRKARTPRHAKSSFSKPAPLVPDLEFAEQDQEEEEEEEQLIYRVPIFDPVLSEFCSRPPAVDGVAPYPSVEDAKPATVDQWFPVDSCHGHGFAGFDPSDMDLAEFAADVESLLGQGLKDDSCIEDALGLVDVREEDTSQVKVEADVVDAVGGSSFDMEMELSGESLDINFDCGSPAAGEEAEEEQKADVAAEGDGAKIGLKLDYEAVITAWSCRSCSPWTGGVRPQFNPDDCWPDLIMGLFWGGGADVPGCYEDIGFGGHAVAVDGGREARVSRYREKRRTRLFSKKIRYEVRKLNAEKRPRMKGRFVKRSSFPAAGPPGGYAYA